MLRIVLLSIVTVLMYGIQGSIVSLAESTSSQLLRRNESSLEVNGMLTIAKLSAALKSSVSRAREFSDTIRALRGLQEPPSPEGIHDAAGMYSGRRVRKSLLPGLNGERRVLLGRRHNGLPTTIAVVRMRAGLSSVRFSAGCMRLDPVS